MYEIDPQPNSDQAICNNCECIVDKLNIVETEEGDPGCMECISNCKWCGKAHFRQNMFLCPYFGLICDECLKADDYRHSVRNKVLKESLRCYFDTTDHGRIEDAIIHVTQLMGFAELALEMKSDKN